jgi:hypothetical protein
MLTLTLVIVALALLPMAIAVAIWLAIVLAIPVAVLGAILVLAVLPPDQRVVVIFAMFVLALVIWWFKDFADWMRRKSPSIRTDVLVGILPPRSRMK